MSDSAADLVNIIVPPINLSDLSDEYIEELNEFEKPDKHTKTRKSHTRPSPWNYRIQLMLKKIGDKCMGMRYLHKEEQEYYEKMDELYLTRETYLLALQGVSAGIQLGIVGTEGVAENRTIFIIVSCLSLLLIAIHYILKNTRVNQEFIRHEIAHKELSTKFNRINLDIQEQFALDLKDRESDKTFLTSIIRSFNDQLDNRETIRKEAKDAYISATEDTHAYKPLLVGGFGQIGIVVNTPNNSSDSADSTESEKLVEEDLNDSKYKYEMDRYLRSF
jgi:hypothetical protein